MRLRRLPLPFAVSLFAIPLFLAAVGSRAQAQQGPPLDRTFSPQLFHPSVGPDDFVATPSAVPLPHLNYSMGLWFNYSRNTFAIYQVDTTGAVTPKVQLLKNALALDVVFAFGLFDRLQIGLGIPMTVFQNGDNFPYNDNGMFGTAQAASGFALGDPWIDIKVRIWGGDRGINIAAAPFISIPASLATSDSFGGESSVTFGANLLGGWQADRWRAGAKFGFLYRAHESHYFSTTIGHELLYGAAFAYDILEGRRLTALLEVSGHTDLSYSCPPNNPNCDTGTGISNVDSSPVEADLAAKARIMRSLYATLGAGIGLTRGVGSPQVRVFLGITFAPDTRDRDKDGVADQDDKCPMAAEDKDGFQDDDGCPDKGKALVKLGATQVEIQEKVFFDSDSARIKPQSFKLLNTVAIVINLHPELKKILIAGHTDDRGSKEHNRALSKARAESVLRFMVDKGVVEEHRLEAQGLGPDQPIVPDAKRAVDREKNRRVEFVIVERSAP